ncbi:uncharacterized protein LOC128217830 [Mya arenaria]|uniref:uncharacterized protein LOC128217830 n=1 Tax=Mya arenaria TaxID=6604 RepID=UPI0022E0FDE0|nr:uncharacterized protein LOC128217830 [Mya arenaria]
MGKSQTFKDRPKPPTPEQILKDLSSADGSDVIFHQQYPAHVSAAASVPSERLQAHSSGEDHSIQSPDESRSHDQAVVNFTYEQVKQLITLYTKLKEEPKEMNILYEKLEKLGDEVSLSIEELKAAAENVLLKTKKTKK